MAVSIAAIVGNVMVVEIMLKKQLDLNGFAMWLPIIEIERLINVRNRVYIYRRKKSIFF